MPWACERAQAQQAGGRLLGAAEHACGLLGADLVDRADQVGAVVDGHLRILLDERLHVVGVLLGALRATGVDLCFAAADQRRGDVILGG